MVGADRSEPSLEVASSLYPNVEFRKLDMLALGALGAGRFDAVLCLWQSFGFGDSSQNRDVLRSMGRAVRPGGRVLMDIYNSDAVRSLPSSDVQTRDGTVVTTRRTQVGRRLRVELEDAGSADSRRARLGDLRPLGFREVGQGRRSRDVSEVCLV